MRGFPNAINRKIDTSTIRESAYRLRKVDTCIKHTVMRAEFCRTIEFRLMSTRHNRRASEVTRECECCERDSPTDPGDQHNLSFAKFRLRHHHAPRCEKGESERRCLHRIRVAHRKQICNRRFESRGVATVHMLADHRDVIRGWTRRWKLRINLRNCCIQEDARSHPRRVDACANTFDDAASIRSANRRILNIDARKSTTNPEIKVIERTGFGAHDCFAFACNGRCKVLANANVWRDGRTLRSDRDCAHRTHDASVRERPLHSHNAPFIHHFTSESTVRITRAHGVHGMRRCSDAASHDHTRCAASSRSEIPSEGRRTNLLQRPRICLAGHERRSRDERSDFGKPCNCGLWCRSTALRCRRNDSALQRFVASDFHREGNTELHMHDR